MSLVISESRRVRKTGAVPVFGFTRAKSSRGQREAAVRVLDGPSTVEEEGALGLLELPLLPAKYQGAELEPRVHVGEEGRQVRS